MANFMDHPGTMRAWQYRKLGGGIKDLVLEDRKPVPAPGRGEILVQVQAASVNPIDWKMQRGDLRPLFPSKMPCTPGSDISGKVMQVGPGVDTKMFPDGEYIVSSGDPMGQGATAEYCVIKANIAVRRPSNVNATDGCSLGVVGGTALQALRAGGIKNIDGSYAGHVLVAGASGGVGTYAVQLAKLAGAHVTATCGARNIKLLKSLGADDVLDYTTREGMKLESPSDNYYDLVLDCTFAGISFPTAQKVLKARGSYVTTLPAPGNFFAVARTVLAAQKAKVCFFQANAGDLRLLTSLAAEGKLRTVIDSTYNFDEFPKAWSKSMEGHATGKIVVTME